MLFFIADTHFGHKNVIKHDKRPFTFVEEMDQAIIDNWNKYVTPKDQVYFLGDWCYRSDELTPPRTAEYYLKKLKGHISIIFGNHDRRYARRIADKFYGYSDFQEIKYEHQKITLCHYALRTWPSSHHGSFHLHGHSHGNLAPWGKSLDVGIMNKGWKPDTCWLYSFEEIKKFMEDKPVTLHHTDYEDY